MIQEMHDVLKCAKQCMRGAQERSKFYVDFKRSLIEFEIGHEVFLKVTPKYLVLKLGQSIANSQENRSSSVCISLA